ncbi:hypothetical protein GCM10027049_25690 [Mucilaginibacter puniceus]
MPVFCEVSRLLQLLNSVATLNSAKAVLVKSNFIFLQLKIIRGKFNKIYQTLMFIVCIVSNLLKVLNEKTLLVVTKNIFFKVKHRYGSI